jgi:hypothetical protein
MIGELAKNNLLANEPFENAFFPLICIDYELKKTSIDDFPYSSFVIVVDGSWSMDDDSMVE